MKEHIDMDVSALPPALPTGLDDQPLWIGSHPAMLQAARDIVAVAATDRTGALILGESGTGKELVARAIHQHSRRAARPFVPVNCGAIPPTLAESELFGSERGSFTDARSRKGLAAQAHTGTLFLDEIGELSSSVQRSLLRFLETRQYQRLGSEHRELADVRVIAATLRDLAAATRDGSFRHDLFFRVNVFIITLPPLRERHADLPALVALLLTTLGERQRRQAPPSCDDATHAILAAYPWPGNLRELRNALEHALVRSAGGTILPEHLPPAIRAPQPMPQPPDLWEMLARCQLPPGGVALPALVQMVEETLIRQALERTSGNQSRAAAILGLSRDQLRQRLKRG